MTTTPPDLSADLQFEEALISSVEDDGRTVGLDTGWHLGVPAGPFVPRVGQTIRMYGRGTGYPVRGIVIDGQVFRYQTEAEHLAEWHREVDEQRERDRAAYLERRAAQEAEIARLPEPFQRRLNRFLSNAPETAWAHQGYELAVCQAAVAIAEAVGADVQAFQELKFDEQLARVPLLGTLELSGNQFGMACRLAYSYHVRPEYVWQDCAAISLITGCKEAGCVPGEG